MGTNAYYSNVFVSKGEEMKKIVLFGIMSVMTVTCANAGLLESLGLAKKSEPATLEEACDTAEIKKICPEVLLGTKTMTECLSDNIKSLSTQCANYVKKSIAAKKDAIVEKVAESKGASDAQGENVKSGIAAKIADAKAGAAQKKAEADAKAKADKEAAAAKKAAATAAAKEISDSLKQTGQDVKETGQALKALF